MVGFLMCVGSSVCEVGSSSHGYVWLVLQHMGM